jgi:VWFA-related protein
LAGFAALVAPTPRLRAQERLLSGKVVMEDGSPPPKPVVIMRSCGGRNPVYIASTNKLGEVRWEEAMFEMSAEEDCTWRAVLAGFESDVLDMGDLQKSDRLQNIVLRRESSVVPAAAAPLHQRAFDAIRARKWSDAEATLRKAVAQYPRSAPLWEELGGVLEKEDRPADARPMFERAVSLAPSYLRSYAPLIQLQIDAGDYEQAEKTAIAGVQADVHGTLPELDVDLAEIRVHLKEDGVEAPLRKAIALDRKHAFPRAEYLLGLVLAEGDDYASAIEHLRRYLELQPRAPEAASIRARIEDLRQSAAADAAEAASSPAGHAPLDRSPEGATSAVVPGGLQALAIMARLKSVPPPADFFLEYCRVIAADADLAGRTSDPGLAESVEGYLAAAVQLAHLADNRAGRITLSPDSTLSPDASRVSKTATVLKLFGWKSNPKGGVDHIEIGELPADSPRQQIPSALGVDEIEVAKTLASGASFHFEIHSAEAPVLEARAWRAMAGGLPPGGFAEVFIRNPRYAAAYAGLAAMGPGAASALISGVGLRALVNKYADLLRLYGESFAVSGDRAAVPGGPPADAVWERLAGASARDPKAFFAALLTKDQGKLAAFYSALAGAGAARQAFFMGTAATAEQYYKWYRDSDDFRSRFSPNYEAWRRKLFQELPLDAGGGVHFPGGKAAWIAPGTDADILTAVPAIQALVPIANLEQARKTPLDEESARLLALHYAAWRPLFPYFENLPGLGRAEFEALAAFEKSASARPPDDRNAVLAEWHSLVKLLELGTKAGSIDAAGGARGFRRVCEALSAPDHSAQSLAALREIAGGADDLDQAVPATLLRLRGERRASFDRIKILQKTPSLTAASGAARTPEALTCQVYAALLDPDFLLVSEDARLAARHDFLAGAAGSGIFAPSSLETFHHSSSTHFSGGFADFEAVAATLPKDKSGLAPQALPAASPSLDPDPVPLVASIAPVALPGDEAARSAVTAGAVFRASARLVEVYATVTEEGHFVDNLGPKDFTLLDNGTQVPFGTFENRAAGVTVALVLDTTGSMMAALPALKGSALKLIDDLRPIDTVAVYSFNESVNELQSFTTNKDLARRAILRTRAAGNTGLHDALVRVSHDLAGRSGKKAIVVFTDGADNVSALTADAVIRAANSANVRVYTISHGDALASHDLTDELANLARSTGGLSFAIANPSQIDGVFEHIAQDLLHGYFLAFQPAPVDGSREWRTIQIVLRDNGDVNPPKARARSGYFPGD